MASHPYYDRCPKCKSLSIKDWETGLKECEGCGHETEPEAHPAIWAVGPGITSDMDEFDRQKVMNNYFIEDRCMACGCKEKLKQVGYTELGRGIPAKLCKMCRHPNNVYVIRLTYKIQPQDQEYIAKQQEAALAAEAERQRQLRREEGERAYADRRKRPVIGQSGKTARKKAKKSNG